MIQERIPLLSPKAFSEFTPEEYKDYVISLHKAPPAKPIPAAVTWSLTKTGKPSVRIKRQPKFVTATEVGEGALSLGVTYQELWMHLRKKKIEIKVTEVTRLLKT
jgi:hypothetical protein